MSLTNSKSSASPLQFKDTYYESPPILVHPDGFIDLVFDTEVYENVIIRTSIGTINHILEIFNTGNFEVDRSIPDIEIWADEDVHFYTTSDAPFERQHCFEIADDEKFVYQYYADISLLVAIKKFYKLNFKL